jgi:hypothetical protein
MPANTKYLSSPGQRWLKISAAIIGGYLVTMALHNAIGIFITPKSVIALTSAYSAFIVWVAFMILAFLFKNGWKVWGLYLLITIICGIIIFFFR